MKMDYFPQFEERNLVLINREKLYIAIVSCRGTYGRQVEQA